MNGSGAGPVLVALDGSELAEGAIPHAVALARALHAGLVFFSAFHQVDTRPPPAPYDESARSHFSAYLTGLKERLAHAESKIAFAFGGPASEIVDAAKKMRASVIVMASHGRTGISRWAYGSTTWSVTHETSVPVLVVKQAALRPLTEEITYRHIMVPLDGSDVAERALPLAERIARASSARASLVRVVNPRVEVFPHTAVPGGQMGAVDETFMEHARTYMEARRHALSPLAEVGVHLLQGPAAGELLEFAQSSGVDLIVMTTHARTGIARAFLGSVAERMLHGTVPVVLVPPSG